MAGLIPQAFIDELVSRADIYEVINRRVPLKKAGREYKACCPFHNENTPSFTVSPAKGFYHCFGCGAHGTAISFLMEHDHLSFVEAVEELGARCVGLEVPREDGDRRAGEPQGLRRQLYERDSKRSQARWQPITLRPSRVARSRSRLPEISAVSTGDHRQALRHRLSRRTAGTDRAGRNSAPMTSRRSNICWRSRVSIIEQRYAANVTTTGFAIALRFPYSTRRGQDDRLRIRCARW